MRKTLATILSCCTLALTLGLVACSGDSPSSSGTEAFGSAESDPNSPSSDKAAKAEYDRAGALYEQGKYYSAKEAYEKSEYGDWEQRAAECAQPMPETGELFHDPNMTSNNMILNFIVNDDGAGTGTYISVYTKDNTLVETVFIKGGGSVETRLPGGEYYVKDSTGTEWYGEDEQFGPDGHYESMVFNSVEGDPCLVVLEEGYQWDIIINDADSSGRSVESQEESWGNR